MEFGQLMAVILVYVSCKFEMYIFEIAQVIGENVAIAFLYVLSIPWMVDVQYQSVDDTRSGFSDNKWIFLSVHH